MPEASMMRGRLAGISAGAIEGATVTIRPAPADWRFVGAAAVAPASVQVAATGQDGTFDVELIVPGRYAVFVELASGERMPAFESDVPAVWITYADVPEGALTFGADPLVFGGAPLIFTAA